MTWLQQINAEYLSLNEVKENLHHYAVFTENGSKQTAFSQHSSQLNKTELFKFLQVYKIIIQYEN